MLELHDFLDGTSDVVHHDFYGTSTSKSSKISAVASSTAISATATIATTSSSSFSSSKAINLFLGRIPLRFGLIFGCEDN
ncbi:hypothetical protein AYI69_g2597 [Smittium culicis]|uniref:Uncharacterized protein n=1 Tax=Smittium culicis TaxID=133412 RepID=A0A1R1YLZ7_9FUNG|nr:hypothetical protein AYI69_g2597 [Smittium culicis]